MYIDYLDSDTVYKRPYDRKIISFHNYLIIGMPSVSDLCTPQNTTHAPSAGESQEEKERETNRKSRSITDSWKKITGIRCRKKLLLALVIPVYFLLHQ